MLVRNILLLLAIISLSLTEVGCQDPCENTNYKTIKGEDKRSPDYIFDSTVDNAFSDDRLTTGWYRVLNDGGEDMPTSPPGTFRCGTWYPIWLKGGLPTTTGQQITKPVCMETFSDACEKTWNIEIKYCPGDYLVYELKTSPVIDSAYCFGNDSKILYMPERYQVSDHGLMRAFSLTFTQLCHGRSTKCSKGTSSETGFTPCYTIVLMPEVRNDTVATNVNTEPIFKCHFTDNGHGLLYDVYWYINGYGVKTLHNVGYLSVNDADLNLIDWKTSFPNVYVVKCSVRARFNVSSTPGYKYDSEDFVVNEDKSKSTTRISITPVPSAPEKKSNNAVKIVAVIVVVMVVIALVILLIVVKTRKSRSIVRNATPMYAEFGIKSDIHAYDTMTSPERRNENQNTTAPYQMNEANAYDIITPGGNSESNEQRYVEFLTRNDANAYDSVKPPANQISKEKKTDSTIITNDMNAYDIISPPEILCLNGKT